MIILVGMSGVELNVKKKSNRVPVRDPKEWHPLVTGVLAMVTAAALAGSFVWCVLELLGLWRVI